MQAVDKAASTWRRDLAWAVLVGLCAIAINAAGGFRQITGPTGDNDSLLRLVDVRDLLAGQGWFDLHQYRMGPAGGFVIHWSRLVDAPIAAIVLAGRWLSGSEATAEFAAKIVWPFLLFAGAVFVIVRMARRFAGDKAAVPATVMAAAACFFSGIFGPGALDHHNIQLLLTAASLCCLMEAPFWRPAAFLSGMAAAVTLAIGMETAPYVAVLGLCAAVLFVLGPDDEARIAREYGLGFAAMAAAAFVATVPPSAWRAAQCDAYSAAQFVLAALGGAGLALAASLEPCRVSRGRRVAAVAAIGALAAIVAVAAFPQCLSSPYGQLDPRLQTLWLDHIAEAYSALHLARTEPFTVIGFYATPVLAIWLVALRVARGESGRADMLTAALLLTAFAVSLWQVRGATFAIAFAIVPLSGWVGGARQRASAAGAPRIAGLAMAAAWLASLNVVWTVAAVAATQAVGSPSDRQGSMAGCKAPADFAVLGRQAPTTVLAVSDLGSSILAYTGHRALAGPYHRDVAGNLSVLDAFLGTADEARAVISANHVGLVAICAANPETQILTAAAPGGFLAQMLRGDVPDWLEPVADANVTPLVLYRVRTGS